MVRSFSRVAIPVATAYIDAGWSGTGVRSGFSRISSIEGRSRNIRRNPLSSAAAPSPTAPRKRSCSSGVFEQASRTRDANSQDRGVGHAFASRSPG